MPCKPEQRVVPRPRLGELLDQAAGARLVLVAAPAGFGKTTAVSQWCAAGAAAVAWVTLDGGDNDPTRLWTYVATAVDRVRQGLGRGALQRLTRDGYAVDEAIDELANGLRALEGSCRIVLDDAEAITHHECLASLDHALGRLPENAQLVLLSRGVPDLRLAQLRARGELAELQSSDLAFTSGEAERLLNGRERLGLDAADVDILVERTEGWPAALVLAAVALRAAGDRRAAVRRFGGDQPLLVDYLGDEVLASIDADARALLLESSILGRFTAAMCDDVLARAGSADVLAGLARDNLFVYQARGRRLVPGAFASGRLRTVAAGGGSARHGRGDPPARRRLAACAAAARPRHRARTGRRR